MRKGFTFIELILYVAIITIVMGAILPFALGVVGSGAKNRTQGQLYTNAQFISARLSTLIRNSTNINTGSSNFDVNLASNPSNQLSLQVSAPDNPTIINVSGGNLRLTLGASPAVVLNPAGTVVSSLVFTNYSSADSKTKNIGFTFTLTSTASTRKEFTASTSLRGSAELRGNQ